LLILRDSETIAAMARSYAFAAVALLLALAACRPSPASPPRHVDAAPPGASLSTGQVEELRALARQLDALARTQARSAELEQLMPRWVFARGGAAREPVGEALRRELLAILADPAAEPRLRSFAVLRLVGALDLADLPAFGPLAEERADAGDFPLEVLVTQRVEPSYAVRWGHLTLGDVARLAPGSSGMRRRCSPRATPPACSPSGRSRARATQQRIQRQRWRSSLPVTTPASACASSRRQRATCTSSGGASSPSL
jgi:hypothetical protein